jgi:hypothetical protein
VGVIVVKERDNGGTPKTPSGHETLSTGQRLFAALTHNEIAHLLEVLLGILSPDMVENVLDQLQPDTNRWC